MTRARARLTLLVALVCLAVVACQPATGGGSSTTTTTTPEQGQVADCQAQASALLGAVTAYFNAHGANPTSSSQLVPTYLAQLPAGVVAVFEPTGGPFYAWAGACATVAQQDPSALPTTPGGGTTTTTVDPQQAAIAECLAEASSMHAAVAAYAKDHGAAPTSSNQLVPTYLPQLPTGVIAVFQPDGSAFYAWAGTCATLAEQNPSPLPTTP